MTFKKRINVLLRIIIGGVLFLAGQEVFMGPTPADGHLTPAAILSMICMVVGFLLVIFSNGIKKLN